MDEDPPLPPANALLEAIKAHRLYRVAGGYIVVAWIVLQAAAIVLPGFGAPPWVLRALMILLALGFGAALLAGWALDRRAAGRALLPRAPQGRLAWTLTALLPAALVTTFFLLRPLPRPVATVPPPAIAVAPAPAAPDKSVAVLPFENLSADKENAFFADGVQDEVLTDLSKVADLKVISRTSVMQYRDPGRNLREIGHALDVAFIVEGSVQSAGNKIRVMAQLIDARTDVHQWAEHYDRDLADVFAIQSEIAQNIASQLQSKLSPGEKAAFAQPPTTDLKAYEFYTRARVVQVWDNPGGAEGSLREKLTLLEDAVRHDPGFALAYCELSKTYDDYEDNTGDHAYLEPARQAAEKAIQLRPDLGETHRELARYYLHAENFGRARDEAAIALRTLPNDAETYRLISEANRAQDHWEEALGNMEKAHELDPSDYEIEYYLGTIYESMRRYKEREQMLLKNRAVSKLDTAWVQICLAENKLDEGDPAAARDFLARVPPDFSPTREIWDTRFAAALLSRDYVTAERVIAATPTQWQGEVYRGQSPQTWDNGMLTRLRGDEGKARVIFTAARTWTTTAWDDATRVRRHLTLLSLCDAGLGHKADALREARELCAQFPLASDPAHAKVCMENLAMVYALTGESAQAIDQLESLARMYDTVSYGELRCSPYWDALRGDPRFEKIVASLAPKP